MADEREVKVTVVVDGSQATAGFAKIEAEAKAAGEAIAGDLTGALEDATAANLKLEASAASQALTNAFRRTVAEAENINAAFDRVAAAGSIPKAMDLATNGTGNLTSAMRNLANVSETSFDRAHAAAQKLAKGAENAGSHIKGLGGIIREAAVLIREVSSGNFTRLAGSASILAQRMGGIEFALKNIGAVGLIGFAAVAAAAIAVGVAVFRSQDEVDGLTNKLSVMNNQSGLTADGFRTMADKIAAGSNLSSREIGATLAALESLGNFSKTQLQNLGPAVEKFAALTGQSGDEVAKAWAKMAKGPTAFAQELSQSTNLLSFSIIAEIKQLEEAGNKQGALDLLTKALKESTDQQTVSVTGLSAAWHGFTNAIGSGIDHMVRMIARTQTVTEKLSDMQTSLNRLKQNSNTFGNLFGDTDNANKLQGLINKTQALATEADKVNRKKSEAAEIDRAGSAALKAIDDNTKSQTQGQRGLNLAMDEYHQQLNSVRAAASAGNKAAKAELADLLAGQKDYEAQLKKQFLGADKKVRGPSEKSLARDEIDVLRDALQEKRDLYAADGLAHGHSLDLSLQDVKGFWAKAVASHKSGSESFKLIERESLKARIAVSQEARQIELQLTRNQLEDARQNAAERLRIELELQAKMGAAKGSLEELNQTRVVEKAKQDLVRETAAIAAYHAQTVAAIEIDNAKEAFTIISELEKQGLRTKAQVIAAKILLIEEEGRAQRAALLVSDPGAADTKGTAKIKDDMAKLDADIQRQKTAAEQQGETERNALQLAGIKKFTSGLGNAFGQLATGQITFAQAITNSWKNALSSISGFISKMFSNYLTQKIATLARGDALSKASHLKENLMAAKQAAGNAWASAAKIPYIGYLLAPPAAVAAFSGVMAYAAQGYDVPGGVNPVTQLHQKEMVLPAPLAERVRSMSDSQVAKSAKESTVNIHYSPTINHHDMDISKALQSQGSDFLRWMQNQVRNGQLRGVAA